MGEQITIPKNPNIFWSDQHFRLDVERYHQMIAAGILGEDDRVELLEGVIIEKMAINPPHAAAVRRTRKVLAKRIDLDEQDIHQESPVSLDGESEFEPDLMVVAARDDEYTNQHPIAQDVALVVEVSDESLFKDRKVKRPVYAAAGIPEFWIVNLRESQLERYTVPRPMRLDIEELPTYESAEVFAADASFDHPTLGEIKIADLLPPPGSA